MKDSVFDDGPFEAIKVFAPGRAANVSELAYADGAALGAEGLAGLDKSAAEGLYPRLWKRTLDIAFVLMTLPILLPVTLLCALALWIEGGQPFYRQKRLGEGGREFSIFKLRTMCRDADAVLESYLDADPALRAEWDRTQKLKNDPRITPVGRIIRRYSIDELPQLINVLKGEMSLVGPRPALPSEVAGYPAHALGRLTALPGITGVWQVSGRADVSFDEMVEMDIAYARSISLRRDLAVLILTIPAVLSGRGAY